MEVKLSVYSKSDDVCLMFAGFAQTNKAYLYAG